MNLFFLVFNKQGVSQKDERPRGREIFNKIVLIINGLKIMT